MDLARAPCRAPLTARKKGSGYENDRAQPHSIITRWGTVPNLVPRVPVFKGSGARGGTLANSDCQVTK